MAALARIVLVSFGAQQRFMPLDILQPLYYRLEKAGAAAMIPKAHTVPGRRRLADVPPPSGGKSFDHSAWDRVLKRHVHAGGAINGVTGINTVDYAGVSKDNDYDAYLKHLADADVDALPPAEQLALWMNAYNALCISLVVQHERAGPEKPLESVTHLKKDGTGVFDQPAGVVGGKTYTLNQIEHEQLRKSWAEPAVHGCIVCASASCPNLRAEAFVAGRLREQMAEQMQTWLKNPTKGLLLESKSRVQLSRIFLWFADDFGGEFGGVGEYLRTCGVDEAADKALASKLTATRYFKYDWTLNRTPAS